MAIRVLLGGEIREYSEGQVETIDGKRCFFWHARLYTPYFKPSVLVLTKEIPKCGMFIVKGEFRFSRRRLILVAEEFNWGGRLSFAYCTARVEKVIVRGEIYRCVSEGIPFLFRQVEGLPLSEGEVVCLEGTLRGKKTEKGWNLEVEGKQII